MPETKVILVLLRQPRKNKPNETRPDPFWEFGSFGCTSCHSNNLMHPRNADLILGSQLAFSQGGPQEFRLVHLTPPISEVVVYSDRCEAKWVPAIMPFRYDYSPLLIDNQGTSEVPTLKKSIEDANRTTWCGKFSSKFRSRKQPIGDYVAGEIRKVYQEKHSSRTIGVIAKHYVDALPYPPPLIDNERESTYQSYITRLEPSRLSTINRNK